MKKYILIFSIFCIFNMFYGADAKKSQKVEVSAKSFKSVGNTTIVSGDVHIVKGRDVLDSDTLKIRTDKNRKPLSYEATGNVRFFIVTNDGRELNGKSKRLTYDVSKNEYRLYEDAMVQEVGVSNAIRGDLIVLTNNGDFANVVGTSEAPAHVTFYLDDKDKKSK